MSKIDTKLEQWLKAGLLNKDQIKKIRDFENRQSGNSWLLYGFLCLGAAIVLIGVISLIAANWKLIPVWLKLSIHFGLFGFFVWLSYYFYRQGKELFFEVLLSFTMLYSFASIGLVSQVYHTGGEVYQAGLLWSMMNFGFIFLTRKSVIPTIWSGVFFSSLTALFWQNDYLKELYWRNVLPLYLGLPFFCFGFTFLFKKYGGEYLVTKVFRQICFVIGIIGLFLVEINVNYLFQKPYLIKAFIPSYLLIALSIGTIIRSSEYRIPQKKLLIFLIALYFIMLHLPVLRINHNLIVAALSIAIFILAAIYMVSLNYKKLFEVFLIFIFIRFFLLYLQAFGGLAQTGIGLIASGLIMIGMVLLWSRYRKRMNDWAYGVLQ